MILIVDDDAAVRSSLTLLLKRAGFETQAVDGTDKAVAKLASPELQLILMDMNFSLTTSGEEGLRMLRRTRATRPEIPVILITAWASIALAVEGMRAGAFDFIAKPWNNAALIASIRTALELNSRSKAAATPFKREATKCNFDKIIGCSDALMNALALVAKVAHTDAAVLITGESGTGKELIAEAIHINSPRAAEPFVKVNLGGLSHNLFESEMFGHRKGAFTDAFADRTGRFEAAGKGTVFLDEIGELDLACQVKLLRVLQDRTFEPLGDSRSRQAEARIVSATNRPLKDMIAERTFREDLFYRINLIGIHLPPLRERPEDIELLSERFLAEQCRVNGLAEARLTASARSFLRSQPWPGNVRELKNLVERTVLVSGKAQPEADDFARLTSESAHETGKTSARLTLDEQEKHSIAMAVRQHAGNLSKAAAALGISRAALYRRMEKHGIRP
ncbi:MAG: sigma-54 dependent transcriptional regulator [Tannerellaceae bacterium]|jgi:two-component system NtrC family response regulator|nr:sigma-54 dependent transcriptional regulator [Tannerellaceae bacterium]